MKLSPKRRAELRIMFGGRCAYCGIELPEKGWHADHIKPIMREGKWVRINEDPHRTHKYVQTGTIGIPTHDTIDNFFPSCRACNINKSCMSLEEWRGYLEKISAQCRRDHAAFRHAERFGRVVVVNEPLVFYFEKYLSTAKPHSA